MKFPFKSPRYGVLRRKDLEEIGSGKKEDEELWQEIIARAIGENSFKKFDRGTLILHCRELGNLDPANVFYPFALALLETQANLKTQYFAQAYALRAEGEWLRALCCNYAEHLIAEHDYLGAIMLYLQACLGGEDSVRWLFDCNDYPKPLIAQGGATLTRLLIGLYLLNGHTPCEVRKLHHHITTHGYDSLLAMQTGQSNAADLWLAVARDVNKGMKEDWRTILLGIEKAYQLHLLNLGYYFNIMSYLLTHAKQMLAEKRLTMTPADELNDFLKDRLVTLAKYIPKTELPIASKIIENFTQEVMPHLGLPTATVLAIHDEFLLAKLKVLLKQNLLTEVVASLDAFHNSITLTCRDLNPQQQRLLGFTLFQKCILRGQHALASDFLQVTPLTLWDGSVLAWVEKWDVQCTSQVIYRTKLKLLDAMTKHPLLRLAELARIKHQVLASPFITIQVLLSEINAHWEKLADKLTTSSWHDAFKRCVERGLLLLPKREKESYSVVITNYGKWLESLKAIKDPFAQTPIKVMSELFLEIKKRYAQLPAVEIISPSFVDHETVAPISQHAVLNELASLVPLATMPPRKTAEDYMYEMIEALAVPPRPPSPIGLLFARTSAQQALLPIPAVPLTTKPNFS